jgi:hypothetical protein
MMSLVGLQTRPGEPANYPLEWLRDGAYGIVGLVRAGRLDVARELLPSFIEQDYFGGFGAEGDAPGFGIWTLSEVTRAARDPEFERTLYPHVYRKAELIGQLMKTQGAFLSEPVGNIVPGRRHRGDVNVVADPMQDGLIMGRMDWGRPALYISAISYLGLTRAIEMARAAGDEQTVARWSRWAGKLQKAWQEAYEKLRFTNERVFISGMHPSFVAGTKREMFAADLAGLWKSQVNEQGELKEATQWTYFLAAQIHQRVLLGQREMAWQGLEYLFKHQSSPGLYTWWEGNGEENSYGKWEQVRGWFKPDSVTPHYWTAAEVLLSQLSILAHNDESSDEVVWVIGAGVPTAWLGKPFSVANVGTARGRVDYTWDGKTLSVRIDGPRGKVQAGSAFPAGSLQVEFVEPIAHAP